MENTEVVEKEGGSFSWPGCIAGFVVGVILFWLTIMFIKATMFSLTAA